MSQVLIGQYFNNLADLNREYALNLKREFPRIPFYPDFWAWAAWGEELMDLHIGYEKVMPANLKRTDKVDEKLKDTGASPKAILKADKEASRIVLDSETSLSGIPAEAWAYRLGNRCALEWILDRYKEKKPKDPTIREKFNTYRFADYKEKVIDLLLRVTMVSAKSLMPRGSAPPATQMRVSVLTPVNLGLVGRTGAGIRGQQVPAGRGNVCSLIRSRMEPTPSHVPTTDRCDLQTKSAAELAQLVFASKAERRRWLAALPVEEKYRRFLQLQRMASAIRRAAGKPSPAPWPE